MQIKIFRCENSVDGIFTGIYQAWSSGYGHGNVKVQIIDEENAAHNLELFSEYIEVITNYELSMKVAHSVRRKLSNLIYEIIVKAALSDNPDKADLIYRFLIKGFAEGPDIVEHLSDDVVSQILKIHKNVGNEAHHLLGFLRFSRQENGTLTSVIHPKNNVLTLIAPHFADRLNTENFIIYDGNRQSAVFHAVGRPWVVMEVGELRDDFEKLSMEEDGYQTLWKSFFEHIAIKERINPKLQRNNLPMRFRGDMTEFQ